MKPPKVADAPRGIDRYEVRAIDRNLIRAIERAMWLDHGRELGDGEYGEPDIARTLHWLLTEKYLDKGWHVASFDNLPQAIGVAHGCNRSGARAVYFAVDRMPDIGYRVEGPTLPPEMAMQRHREYMDRWFDAIHGAMSASIDKASDEGLMQKAIPTFRVGALDMSDGKWTTDHASELASPRHGDIPRRRVGYFVGPDAPFPTKPLWLWLPRINQPRMPWLTPRRPQLNHPVARMAVDGITTPTPRPKEDR